MKYIVQHEGQEIPISESIGQDVDKLRRALTSVIPGIAEAKINSIVEGDVTTYTIVKTAGTKGSDIIDHLVGCTGGINPVVALYKELGDVDLSIISAEAVVVMDGKIRKAIELGQHQHDQLEKGFERLAASVPQPAPMLVAGF